MRAPLPGLVLLALALTGPSAALAEPAQAEPSLRWDAEPPCLDEATARAALGALLGEGWDDDGVQIEVRLGPAQEGFELSVRTLGDGEASERMLADPSCEALSEAGILVVALAIRPDLDLGPGDRELLDRLLGRVPVEAEAESPQETTPVAAPFEDEPTPPPACPEPEPTPRLQLAGAMFLRGGIGWGMLPTLEAGPSAGAAVLLPRARFELDARGWFGPDAQVQDASSVAISGWNLGARGGPSWSAGPLALPLMVGTEVGQLVGRPQGLRAPTVQRPTWFALTASFGVVYSPLERLGLTAMFEGFVAVTRPTFSVQGVPRAVHTPRQGGVRALLGVEARLGR